MADDENQTIVTGAVICQLLMLTRQRIDQLVNDGWLKRHSPGHFSLVETVQGYIRFLRDDQRRSNKSAADSRVRDAQARDIEVRTQIRLAQLVPLAVYEETIDDLCGMVRSESARMRRRLFARSAATPPD